MVYLITGKAGAGKTHYSKAMAKELIKEGKYTTVIDGDKFRKKNKNQDFSDEGRIKNLMSAAVLASELESRGDIAILAFIAPKKQWRDEMRKLWTKSRVIYIPGGHLWPNTEYEKPTEKELRS